MVRQKTMMRNFRLWGKKYNDIFVVFLAKITDYMEGQAWTLEAEDRRKTTRWAEEEEEEEEVEMESNYESPHSCI